MLLLCSFCLGIASTETWFALGYHRDLSKNQVKSIIKVFPVFAPEFRKQTFICTNFLEECLVMITSESEF